MKSKPRLLVLNPTCLDVVEEHRAWIESQGVELLADQSNRTASESQLVGLLKGADAVVLPASFRQFPFADHMAACPQLKVCAIAASGFEWLDISAATTNGIVVCFAPGGEGAEVVAEMAFAMMFAVARQIPHHHTKLCRGDESRGMGTSLFGKTLGIVGLGRIGQEVALRAPGLKLRPIAYDPQPVSFAAEHGVELVPLDQLLRESDFVSLHARLSQETKKMIGRREFALMKPTAYLINTARRELVDETAVVEAIVSGKIAGAGLDDPPGADGKQLLGLPNVVFTPHIGNRSIEGVHSVFRRATEGALQALRGERATYVVNPEVYISKDLRTALNCAPERDSRPCFGAKFLNIDKSLELP